MSDECRLSAQGRAFSTILTAFVGSIVTGVSDGPEVAFFIGWICWLAAVRIILVSGAGALVTLFGPHFGIRQPFIAVSPNTRDSRDEETVTTPLATAGERGIGNENADDIELGVRVDLSSTSGPPAVLSAPGGEAIDASSVTNQPGDDPKDTNAPVDNVGASGMGFTHQSRDVSFLGSHRSRDVSFLGSMGWVYTFIYTPILQILWVKANWSLAPTALLVARAIGVSVSALSYTIDTRARYGTALGKKLGSEKVVPRLMNLYSAVMNMLLSIIVVVLLIHALERSSKSELAISGWVAAPYIFFSVVWAATSLAFLWPTDAGWAGTSIKDLRSINAYKRVFLGLFVGAFAGTFVASPSFFMWQNAKSEEWALKNGLPADKDYTGGKDLGSWLDCTTEIWWKKAVQILP